MARGMVLIREDEQYIVYAIYQTHSLYEQIVPIYLTADLESIRSYVRDHPEVQYSQTDLPELADDEMLQILEIAVDLHSPAYQPDPRFRYLVNPGFALLEA